MERARLCPVGWNIDIMNACITFLLHKACFDTKYTFPLFSLLSMTNLTVKASRGDQQDDLFWCCLMRDSWLGFTKNEKDGKWFFGNPIVCTELKCKQKEL